ncbi:MULTISPECIES: anti-sigma factor [unclassified Streptomyces]|uniref:anti-sigma factor family protein n=1 Tax=unclassified Streptomyces TaxID=2593676 RepID=UPI00070BB539|nr:hypothetical protein [Streptomyces sp. Root264]KRD21276.1 hypothetical protein ASE41_15100 [Streptomyces sp. Root264]
MTSTTDTTGHPDVAEISDLTEGLLDPARSAAVRRHLDSCTLCADVHASLEEIQGLLGSLPEPPRMPDDVARRIDAALASEALQSAAPPGDRADDVHETPASVTADAEAEGEGEGEGEGEAAGVSRETAAASGRPSGHARSATTGPGRRLHKGQEGQRDRRNRKRLGRRRAAVLGAVFTAAALGLGSVLVSSFMDGGSPGTSAQQTAGPDTFSTSKLEGQVAALLTKAGVSRTPQSMGIHGETDSETGSGTGNGSPRVLRQPTVPSCVQQGIGRSDTALATEEGTYHGTAALLVVLPDASDSTRVDAYIVDKACATHPSAGPADVLLTTSYPRH